MKTDLGSEKLSYKNPKLMDNVQNTYPAESMSVKISCDVTGSKHFYLFPSPPCEIKQSLDQQPLEIATACQG
jgi:hypothetical protein